MFDTSPTEHHIRVVDTAPSITPYASRVPDFREWSSIAGKMWHELGLPPQPPPDPSWEPCYVRWGDCPEGGQSYNHQLQEHEPGVAVFRAYHTPRDEYVLDLQHSPILAILYVRLSTSGRRFYRVRGVPCSAPGGGG